MKKYFLSPTAGAVVIAILVSLLYIPFLSNPLVFDDHAVFKPTHEAIKNLVETPFNLSSRTFPYYTLGQVQILFGSIEANRIVSLILHMLCAWVLYGLVESLVRQALKTRGDIFSDESQLNAQSRAIAFIAAIWFAINPVAVYGAGYLAQRTILFATLFSLLSLWYYGRAFSENRTSDIFFAALFYSAAVFSKEHSIMLPAAAIMLTTLYAGDWRANAKRIGLCLLLCAPAAITVLLGALHVIGTNYEPSFNGIAMQIHGIPMLDKPHGPWIVSSLIQAGFFVDYFFYWIVPNVHSMSVDMRFDFEHLWTAWWLIPKAALFVACPVAGLYLLRRRGPAALFGCGLLYCWLLYLTELSSVRFQEPFVLYRSYLWAPGYTLMIAAVCCSLPRKWMIIIAIPVFFIFFQLASERLQSFKSEYLVWNDAAVKLESETLAGADRIFYNRGLRYLKAKKYTEALADFSRAATQNPSSRSYYHRGVAYYSLNDFVNAEADFNRAFELNKKDGAIAFAQGLTFEQRGCFGAAERAYSTSRDLGYPLAKLRLGLLAKNISKSQIKPGSGSVPCPS